MDTDPRNVPPKDDHPTNHARRARRPRRPRRRTSLLMERAWQLALLVVGQAVAYMLRRWLG